MNVCFWQRIWSFPLDQLIEIVSFGQEYKELIVFIFIKIINAHIKKIKTWVHFDASSGILSCPFQLQAFGGQVRHPSCRSIRGSLYVSIYNSFSRVVQIFPEKLFSTWGDTPLVSSIL